MRVGRTSYTNNHDIFNNFIEYFTSIASEIANEINSLRLYS